MKAISWNVGSYYFLNYAAKREKSFHGHTIRDVYFQPELNGGFVSAQLEAYDADIVFLQEMHSLDDTEHIPALVNYPHRALLPNAHHEHSMLVAAKRTFETRAQGDFTLVESSGITFLPVHLNAHRATARYEDSKVLRSITKDIAHLVLLGDTNIWSRGRQRLSPNDEKAYRMLGEHLIDITAGLRSTTYFGLAFDKAFISPDLHAETVECPHVRSHFMDHYPLVLELAAQE